MSQISKHLICLTQEKYNGQFAALKCSKETTSTMTEEIDLMLQIGNHKNIIKLHGICYYLSKLQESVQAF